MNGRTEEREVNGRYGRTEERVRTEELGRTDRTTIYYMVEYFLCVVNPARNSGYQYAYPLPLLGRYRQNYS